MAHPTDEAAVRAGLAALAARVQAHGYVVATDGNCSARLPGGRFLITPSGVEKGNVRPQDLVLCLADGSPADPAGPGPSSEVRTHVAAYDERPDVQVVVHAHPPAAVALTLAGREVAACLLPEVLIAVGKVATAAYGTPTTRAQADAVRRVARDANAIVLDRHGSVTLGRSFAEAFWLLERLEWSARVTRDALLLAGQAGMQRLPPGEVERLLDVRARLTGEPRRDPCNLCGACVGGARL